jgi:hypothetical protein
MRDYRLYLLDGTGNITSAESLRANSDDEAVAAAKSLKKGERCEIWDRQRLVGRINS